MSTECEPRNESVNRTAATVDASAVCLEPSTLVAGAWRTKDTTRTDETRVFDLVPSVEMD